MSRTLVAIVASCGLAALALACSSSGERSRPDSARATQSDTAVLSVMNAAAVTQPLRAALDSFAAHTGARYAQEPGASLEVARKITELGRRPDVIVLADYDIFPKLLMPRHVRWYALFGRNRIVLAYTDRSRGAASITPATWRDVILQPGVEIGRADPSTDPSGYRTLLTFQLAERYYRQPGLYERLLQAAPEKNVRPREAEQVALLQTGELDYIWTYENLAEDNGLKYVKLPDAIDLGEPADSAVYALAATRVVGKRSGDTLTVRGAPILFALSIAADAPHPALAERFVAFLLSSDGTHILKGKHFDVLDRPVVRGTDAPVALTATDPARVRH